MDAIDIVCVAVVTFNIAGFCPILIYYLNQYQSYSQKVINDGIGHNTTNVTNKRSALLVYTLNILAIFTNCTQLLILANVLNVINLPLWTMTLFLSISWWGLIDVFVIKVYHLYYQQEYNKYIVDAVCKHDVKSNHKDCNWYIVNKNKYGNTAYLLKIMILPYMISIVLDTAANVAFYRTGTGWFLCCFHLTLATIPVSVAIVLFYKSRKINDIYKIRDEIFYQFIVLLCSLSLYMIIYMICCNAANNARFEFIAYLFISYGITLPLALFSTLYPIYLTKQHQNQTPLLITISSINSETLKYGDDSKDSVDLYTQSVIQGIHSIQGINRIISDYDSFKCFMDYLLSEFATEMLLFLVELIQIKHGYQTRNNNLLCIPKRNIISSKYVDVVQNEEIPVPPLQKSSPSVVKRDNSLFQVIDFNINPNDMSMNNYIYTYFFHDEGTITTQVCLSNKLVPSPILKAYENNLYLQMKELYMKYFKENSNYELNISSEKREAVINYFKKDANDKEKDYTLFNVLDECCIEILQLIKQSFSRFTKTRIFAEIMSKNDDIIHKQNVDDVEMEHILNSNELPVLRNATSYSGLKEKYYM